MQSMASAAYCALRKIYECCQFLILCTFADGTEDPSYDWEGRLWGECQKCSKNGQGMSEKNF